MKIYHRDQKNQEKQPEKQFFMHEKGLDVISTDVLALSLPGFTVRASYRPAAGSVRVTLPGSQ